MVQGYGSSMGNRAGRGDHRGVGVFLFFVALMLSVANAGGSLREFGQKGVKVPLQRGGQRDHLSASKVMAQLRGNKPPAGAAHRFSTAKSSPDPDPNEPEDMIPVVRGMPRGRKGALEPEHHSQVNTFGFLSDYYCTARIFDEPRRMRLSCTKNPPRVMNCFCSDKNENQIKIPCRCGPGMSTRSKHINIVDKFVGT